jgi:hypothetical protein
MKSFVIMVDRYIDSYHPLECVAVIDASTLGGWKSILYCMHESLCPTIIRITLLFSAGTNLVGLISAFVGSKIALRKRVGILLIGVGLAL